MYSYSDIEDRLRLIQKQRHLIDEKIKLKVHNFETLNKIHNDSSHRLYEALHVQNENAKQRNRALLDEFDKVYLNIKSTRQKNVTSNCIRLAELKKQYALQMEASLPVQQRKQSAKLEEQVKQLKLEKIQSINRREKLRKEMLLEDKIRTELEQQRRELLMSLAQEQSEIMESKTNCLILEQEGRAVDKAIMQQVADRSIDLRDLLVQSMDKTIPLSHSQQVFQRRPPISADLDVLRAAYSLPTLDAPLTPLYQELRAVDHTPRAPVINNPPKHGSYAAEKQIEVSMNMQDIEVDAERPMPANALPDAERSGLSVQQVEPYADNESETPRGNKIHIDHDLRIDASSLLPAEGVSAPNNIVDHRSHSVAIRSEPEAAMESLSATVPVPVLLSNVTESEETPGSEANNSDSNHQQQQQIFKPYLVEQQVEQHVVQQQLSAKDLLDHMSDTGECLAALRNLFGTVEQRVMFSDNLQSVYPHNANLVGGGDTDKNVQILRCFEHWAGKNAEVPLGGESDELLGLTVMAVVQSKAHALIPLEAFTGVVTVDKLKKEFKKQPRGGSELLQLWDSLVQHLQRLLDGNNAYLSSLSSCFTKILVSHVPAEDKDRLNRKVSNLLQLSLIPPEAGNRSPSPPYRARATPTNETTGLTQQQQQPQPQRSLPVMAGPVSKPVAAQPSRFLSYEGMQLQSSKPIAFEDDDEFLQEDDVWEQPPAVRDIDELLQVPASSAAKGNRNPPNRLGGERQRDTEEEFDF